MSIVRLLARPLLASSFIASGVERLRHTDETVEQLHPTLQRVVGFVPTARPVLDNEKLVARLLGGAQIGGGLLLGIGKFSRLAALLLAGSSALNTVAEYRGADISTKEGRSRRRSTLLKNLSLLGGVLVAAVDTNGRPGLVWRAEHLAGDVRKSAGKSTKSLTKDAKKRLRKADKAVRGAASDVVGS